MGATERMTSFRRTGWAGGSVVATLGTVLVVTTSSTGALAIVSKTDSLSLAPATRRRCGMCPGEVPR